MFAEACASCVKTRFPPAETQHRAGYTVGCRAVPPVKCRPPTSRTCLWRDLATTADTMSSVHSLTRAVPCYEGSVTLGACPALYRYHDRSVFSRCPHVLNERPAAPAARRNTPCRDAVNSLCRLSRTSTYFSSFDPPCNDACMCMRLFNSRLTLPPLQKNIQL